jgi:plasmid stabilization system protein ParE
LARVVITPRAADNLDRLIRTLSLPHDTRDRVRASLGLLADFPEMGAPLHSGWQGFRFLLGPWRWMIVVYVYDETADTVFVVTIRDSRSAESPTAG